MDSSAVFKHLLPRQEETGCTTDNDYDGRLGLRIASVFVIWIGSTLGAVFPVFANADSFISIPAWAFFGAKFFGSGVIIATAFIHLLSPAEDALRDPCLTGVITEYDWVSGIILITIFVLFFVELMVMRYSNPPTGRQPAESFDRAEHVDLSDGKHEGGPITGLQPRNDGAIPERRDSLAKANDPFTFEDYRAQLTAVGVLEFGIIFHSVFIGLTLAVSGNEFTTLFIVLVFHQTFEGLGLGSRLATIPWPKTKRWTPYILGLAYGLTTPIAIAIGLGVRRSYPPGAQTTLIVNGIFDSISAGILTYTGLVELLAHEIIFNSEVRNGPLKTLLSAVALMVLGAGLMALLGKWA